jgi:4-hydroxybenzoate polyprenyltransferase
MKHAMSRMLFLIQVSRPIIWPVLPLVYGLGLHASHATIGWPAVLQMIALTFPMNLVGCGLNDVYDFESDRRSTRRRAIWGAVVPAADRPVVFRAASFSVSLVIFIACLTRNWDNIVATVSLVLIAVFYSVPPIRLKERPPLDSFANGLGYFLLPFAMGYSLNADPRKMPFKFYLLAVCVCGVHALATAADYQADRDAGHRTMAVVYGRRTAVVVSCVAFLVAWLVGDYDDVFVRVYLGVCSVATLIAAFFPVDRLINATCIVILTGFMIAAVCHLVA